MTPIQFLSMYQNNPKKETANERKATEIAKNIVGNDHYSYFDDFKLCAMQAMELKDKQFQKVLDYAENCYGVFSFEQRENFINHIKDIFYGKE